MAVRVSLFGTIILSILWAFTNVQCRPIAFTTLSSHNSHKPNLGHAMGNIETVGHNSQTQLSTSLPKKDKTRGYQSFSGTPIAPYKINNAPDSEAEHKYGKVLVIKWQNLTLQNLINNYHIVEILCFVELIFLISEFCNRYNKWTFSCMTRNTNPGNHDTNEIEIDLMECVRIIPSHTDTE